MDKTADLFENQSSKKKPTRKLSRPIKNSKSFLYKDPEKSSNKPKNIKKSSKKPEITPLKTRPSTYKENSITKASDSFAKVYKNKLSHHSTLKKKPLNVAYPKNRLSRGKSLGETKKSNLKDQRSASRPTLKPQVSATTLKILDMNKKLTPRSSHNSPQLSHRTPDSVRISQGQNLPSMTEKKSKIPEVGYYCKRFSMFDKSKPLYKDPVDITIDKQDFPRLSYDNPFSFPPDPPLENPPPNPFTPTKPLSNEPFSSPTNLIKIYNSPLGKQLKTLQSPNRNPEPKAPRKTIADFDSPGSFAFSLSSSSDDPLPTFQTYSHKPTHPQRDEESQTDLTELVADTQVVAGLKLIGRLSEILHKCANKPEFIN